MARNAEASDASLYNSFLFIDDQGDIMGSHRKPVPTGGERLVWAQGEAARCMLLTPRSGNWAD
jgi:nitrilase